MATKKKMLQASAGNTGGGPVAIEDAFSTDLFTGAGADTQVNNGIDLSGEGGMVWIKSRSAATNNIVWDTDSSESGSGAGDKYLVTNSTAAQVSIGSPGGWNWPSSGGTGFSLSGGMTAPPVSDVGETYAAWTFRKAPRFFDVVTYTGNGVAGRTIAHNLSQEVGMLVIKSTSSTGNWPVFHRANTAAPATDTLFLNLTSQSLDVLGYWNDTLPTDSVFTLGNANAVNQSGVTYVAYLYAHDPLGQSGDGSDGIIACGSYEGNDSDTTEININLGWKPQWLLIKNVDLARSWTIVDVARGFPYGPSGSGAGTTDRALSPNLNTDEDTASSSTVVTRVDPTSTGFAIRGKSAICNEFGTHIYMAIREE
jgi:hypothetical protein